MRRTKEQKALRIYDLLREAHKSINQIWKEFPEIVATKKPHMWETTVDLVNDTLYVAENFFVREAHD